MYGKGVKSVVFAIKEEITAVEATQKDGVFYGDCSDPELSGIPLGQTIIKCLIRECYSKIHECLLIFE
jgi:hypothetical protein